VDVLTVEGGVQDVCPAGRLARTSSGYGGECRAIENLRKSVRIEGGLAAHDIDFGSFSPVRW
jgi:hypothetical protein